MYLLKQRLYTNGFTQCNNTIVQNTNKQTLPNLWSQLFANFFPPFLIVQNVIFKRSVSRPNLGDLRGTKHWGLDYNNESSFGRTCE